MLSWGVVMSTYRDLMTQIAMLEAQRDELRADARIDALRQIRDLMAEFEIGVNEITASKTCSPKPGSGIRSPVPKYRDPATGATWSGRGRIPRWLVGKDLAEFAI